MIVNGRPTIESGTLVLASGDHGQLSFSFGTFSLVFRPDAPQNIQMTTNPMQIRFEGTDNPLGTISSLEIPLQGGQTMSLNLAVYSVGKGSDTARVIHYTLS